MAVLIIFLIIVAAITVYLWYKGKLKGILSGGTPKVTSESLERLKKQAELAEAATKKIQAQAALAMKIKAEKDRLAKAKADALKARQDINNSLRPPQI